MEELHDSIELDRAGGAVEVAEAEKHDGGGHRAEEEIFDAGFLRHGMWAGDGDHDVSGDAGELDAEEEEDDVVGAGDQEDAADREEHEPEEFAGFLADVERTVAGRFAIGGPGEQHEDDADSGGEELDVLGEIEEAKRAAWIGPEAVGGIVVSLSIGLDDEHQREGGDRYDRRDAAGGRLHGAAEEDQRARGGAQDQLRREKL